MSNASNENGQDRADTPVLRSNEGHGGTPPVRCPSWCVNHQEHDAGTPDHALVHYGTQNEAGGSSVQLRRWDWVREGRAGAIYVMLDDEMLTPQQATALAGTLATTAAKDETDEKTIVRTLNLPSGQDYVAFDDVGVVALSSRLDNRRRQEVLSGLGLT